MRWIKSLLQNRERRLEVSTAGKWFIGFTIVLGVVAIQSGNNVIYLLESLLLSSLIFSGIISEYTVSRVLVKREINQAIAGSEVQDQWVLKNPTIFPLYCIELGEWRGGKFEPQAFCVLLKGKSEMRIESSQKIDLRGFHQWQGLVIATSFPFGFAKKIRIQFQNGKRIVWPKIIENTSRPKEIQKRELEFVEGELEEIDPWEDLAKVHWPSSNKDHRLFTRPMKNAISNDEVILDIVDKKNDLELAISRAAYHLTRNSAALVLIIHGEKQRIEGKVRSLDALALLPEAK
jgi:uncharacterized protein (DUF58 family)